MEKNMTTYKLCRNHRQQRSWPGENQLGHPYQGRDLDTDRAARETKVDAVRRTNVSLKLTLQKETAQSIPDSDFVTDQ